ncbi:MAG: Rho termination factor N-terminal domain-containing protein [Candidatus Helarchaeota archaeon]
MNNRNIDSRDLIQTDITSFLKLNSQKIIVNEIFKELKSLSVKKLQEIARYHKIKNRSKMDKTQLIKSIILYKKNDLSIEEWKKILGDKWKLHENGLFFIYKDNSMISGNLTKLNKTLKIQNISFNPIQIKKDLTLKDLSKIIKRKNSFIVVKFGTFLYDFNLIGEAFRILGPNISLLQNSYGTIILKSLSKFIIIAPLIV